MRHIIRFTAVLFGLVFQLHAAPDEQTFEAASVKAVASETGRSSMRGGPGSRESPNRITYREVTLQQVLRIAYDVKPYRISGPGWLQTSRYDIVANFTAGISVENFRAMLQNLLADRFKLALHHETQKLAVYDLTVVSGGPKIKVSVVQRAASAAQSASIRSTPENGGALARATGMPISLLAQFLEQSETGGLAVIDKTGLTQNYDLSLEYAPSVAHLRETALKASGVTNADDLPFPDIFTALKEQLGLKLEKGKEWFDVLVVDHVNRTPEGN